MSRIYNYLTVEKILIFFILLSPALSHASKWSGNFSLQSRNFLHEPATLNSNQHNNYFSAAIEPEFYHNWDDENQSITFTPFYRFDQHDNQRTHGDIRELVWLRTFDSWELKLGISKVFWGVTESQHLVDVINQTDVVENIDGEDKLGQPMIKASFERDWGVMDIFILPGFRERTFTGIEGRPRSNAIIPDNTAQYESTDKDQHIDYAARWFTTRGNWDIGLSYFKGTSREPVLQPALVITSPPTLIAYYPQMQQTGLDIQATTEDWLWKLELISRQWMSDHFYAATAGLEYTFIGVFETDADLGIVAEYLYDDRNQYLTTFFENDLMLGLRIALNDEQSSEALLGFIIDKDTHETLISMEASRRIGNNWKIELEARLFQHINKTGFLSAFEKDDFIQLNLSYYF
ncbi:MAG: hypothetical protein OQK70_00490 [Gammaproteobacteria bacterium]|nr:hypothetical protein [Gammaproteobacteria bacterium]